MLISNLNNFKSLNLEVKGKKRETLVFISCSEHVLLSSLCVYFVSMFLQDDFLLKLVSFCSESCSRSFTLLSTTARSHQGLWMAMSFLINRRAIEN